MGRGRHRLQGVDDEVLKHLEDLGAVDQNRVGRGSDFDGDDRDRTGASDFNGIIEDLFDGDDGLDAGAAFGE